jgi:hypothetical protein
MPAKSDCRTCGFWPVPYVRKPRWIQWVDATLAQNLLLRVYEADFVRRHWFKRNKALFRF